MKTMSDYSPAPGPEDTLRIFAGSGTLMQQAQDTAATYMRAAIRDIDEQLGHGYAAQHPELIAAYMQTASADFGASVIARAIESIGTTIDNTVETVVMTLSMASSG